jgi:hypothetical protein
MVRASRRFLALAVAIALLGAPASSSRSLTPVRSPSTAQCVGCIGAGGGGAASAPCGASVSITVTVESGKCKYVYEVDPPSLECVKKQGCIPTITRTWSGLAPNTPVDFCVMIGGQLFCLEPPPSSGDTGSGSDTRTGLTLDCPGSAAYSVTGISCEVTAAGSATCTECPDQ